MQPGEIVTLSIVEIVYVHLIGALRKCNSEMCKPAYGFHGNGLEIDFLGSAGELAVAKFLNVYWSGSVNTFKTVPDVGGFEVRTTTHENGHLPIRSNDPEAIYILVVGQLPRFRVAGWIQKAAAMQDAFWHQWSDKTRPPAWWIPQNALRPMSELEARKRCTANPRIKPVRNDPRGTQEAEPEAEYLELRYDDLERDET